MATFNIRNVRIKTRMYGLVVLFFLFVLVLGVFGLRFITGIRQNTVNMYRHPFQVVNAIDEISSNIFCIQKTLHYSRVQIDMVNYEEDYLEIINKKKEIEKSFSIIKKSYLGDKERIKRASADFSIWIDSVVKLLPHIGSYDVSEYHNLLGKLDDSLLPVFEELKTMRTFASDKAKKFYEDSNTRLYNYQIAFAIITVLVLILFSIAARIIIFSIVKPVSKLNKFAEEVINGHLTVDKPEKIHDEIDELSYSFSEMTKKLIEANRELESRIEERTSQLQEEIRKNKESVGKLRESEKLFRSMFDSDLFGSVFWKRDGTVVKANDRYLEIIGYTRREFEENGLNWHSVTPEDDMDKVEVRLEEIIGSNTKPFRKKYCHKDGHIVHVLVGAAMVEESPFLGIAFVIDISEQVESEKKLKNYHQSLEDAIKERTKTLETNIAMVDESRRALTFLLEDVNDSRNELERVNLQLDSVNKELEAFSYSVSHDLKAPLRAIDGFSLALKEDFYDKLSDDGREFISLIRRNASKMGQLISDLLSFSRMGRKAIKYETIKLSLIAKEVFEELIENLGERKVELIIESDCEIQGDYSMMKQVFINLISNGVKFTRDKEDAQIRIGCRKLEKDYEIFVKDNGVGFDMKYIDKLFGVFQRLHSDEEFEGTGVGLALVKRILTKHQGTIRAEGAVGEGAGFYMTLPIKDQNEDKEKDDYLEENYE